MKTYEISLEELEIITEQLEYLNCLILRIFGNEDISEEDFENN